ncbi:hypothetical protein BC939DRAFT_533288 [Gamsiella multidivaricata]|uniref:uncharacterized protein n=1 Tax=Gamsiella multidivaricata TaxID=101098 RepID=UPI00221E58E2|nr:uncharacterized protein BC939DRAFT_533288 [Gamsiella multidivaricata]KAG0367416.1 hypothetical protein BGZ54_003910 [Gamsiella multidivaricata]KAI7816776.1 hypothetical protein BC939DRAFT_533288 [Gamsiella multidivaricata]
MSKTPLHIPELRAQIARYVTVKDAITCVQVRKDWIEDFAYPIWHTIDFSCDIKLQYLDQDVFAKYGHHIRVVENLNEQWHLDVILWSQASKLRHLATAMHNMVEFQAYCYEIIQRNIASLEHLDILSSVTPKLLMQINALSPYPATKATSRLSILKLWGLYMTRNAFSRLLQQCPALDLLDIRQLVTHSRHTYETFQHPSLSILTASITQVFNMCSNSHDAAPLLIHFPKLTSWKIRDTAPPAAVSMEAIKNGVNQYCPLLKTLYIETPSNTTRDLLSQAFTALTSVCFLYSTLSMEVIMAILSHQSSLKELRAYAPSNTFYSSDEVPQLKAQFQGPSWVFQMLPRFCTQLDTFTFPEHEMDIGEVENANWGCMDLVVLCIRIRGLNTKETIDRAIQLWVDGRTQSEESSGHNSTGLENDQSIAERVARHLLKFKKLRQVWLGRKVMSVE